MRALFMRGKFTAGDAHAAAMTLAAYSIGLVPFVLMRSVVSTFLARGDTARPVKAALTAAGVKHRVQGRVPSTSRRSRKWASRSRPRSAPGSISRSSCGSGCAPD